MMSNKAPFSAALPVMQQLSDHGYQAYFVGGAVRDYLMQRPINDIDMTTSATPDEVEMLFDHTIPIGKEHGTINVVWQGDNYEVTTFRTEGTYIDHRRPSEVAFVRDLYLDVERRDFTINAIAMDHKFQILDYFNGQQDIQAKVIRTVGNPLARFEEDALRILRGLRFQSQLGFSIDPATYTAMTDLASDISHLAIERIMIELEKLLHGAYVAETFSSLSDIHIWDYLPYFKSLPMNQIRVTAPLTLPQFLAIVMTYDKQGVPTKQLKRSNDEIRHAQRLCQAINQLPNVSTKAAYCQFIYDFGKSCCIELLDMQPLLQANDISQVSPLIFNLQTVEKTWQSLAITSRKQLAIDGKVLMQAFNKKSGPWLKDAIRRAECAVVQQHIPNEEQEIIEWVKANVKIP